MTRVNQDKFDLIIVDLLQDCPNINEANCNNCPNMCILNQELKVQNINEVPDILNTLRLLFIDELVTRTNAMKLCPRFGELTPGEFLSIISNQNHFNNWNADGDLIALY